ncbi:nuclear transport factor 2-like protein [Kineococcus sp. SYSU DK003]|uniref:hypothetical protein n=1 Tax=Kineococcus sp. SYSU DK003 TaxID=3383124 RepID=UPI003D7EF49B
MPEDAQATGRLMTAYFAAMTAGEDLTPYLDPGVTWTDADTGEVFTGPLAVQDHITALHETRYAARPVGTSLTSAAGRAVLEGCFVADTGEQRVPFCLVYDLAGSRIVAMRLYASFTALSRLAR